MVIRTTAPILDIVMEEITDPVFIAAHQRRIAAWEKNLAWMQAHAQEVYEQHRGKCICVAGQELFVSDDSQKVWEMAKTAHPEDEGILSRYIPKDNTLRV